MSQVPIPPPLQRPPFSSEKESGINILILVGCSFVGMLAVAALVFVLMFENDSDKAATLTREAEEYLQEDNLPVAKALLEEAVELHSEDAQRLLEDVNAEMREQQLAEQTQKEAENKRQLAAQQADEERRKKQLEKQEAERLAAEEELRRAEETKEERLRDTIRKELELARKAEEDKKPKEVEPLSLPDLLQQILPSVVVIKGDHGEGSGFVIGPNLICTNHHVIDGTGSAKISFTNGVTRNAQGTLYKSESMDIAILKVAMPTGIPVLELHPHDPRQGVKVFAIGHPGGSKNSVTDGIVSQVHTSDSFQEMTTLRQTGTWVQTNAEINSGNSGGPLINSRGVVVGMSTLGSNSQLGLVNLNFATSASNIAKALRLAKSGERSAFEANPKRKQERGRASRDGPRVTYSYYANGQKSTERYYKNGKPDGPATRWLKNGEEISRKEF